MQPAAEPVASGPPALAPEEAQEPHEDAAGPELVGPQMAGLAALPQRYRESFTTLTDPAAPETARLEAARALTAPAAEPVRLTVAALLASTTPDDPAPRLILQALAENFNPAWRPTLLAGIRPSLTTPTSSGWPEVRRARAIAALALDQHRDTVRELIERLAPSEAPSIRAAATAALIRITGRDDDEARRRGSRDAWAAWFEEHGGRAESHWLAELAAGCSARADRLAAARRDVEAQYRAAMDKLYSASDPEEREAMLLAMLQEPLAAIRQLGLDLVERALDGSQRPSRATAAQIIALLADTNPDIRGRAALLLDRMRPEGAGAPVAEALLREKDPEVAGRLMLALRNWPTPVTRDVTLRWLAFDDPVVRRRAARAILAAVDAGVLDRPEDHRSIVETLRKPAPETLSREGMELLVRFGDTGDREIIASLLEGADASACRLAAAALADRTEYRQRLFNAATADGQILPILVDALASAGPTLADYDAIAPLALREAAGEDLLARIAAALPLADLVEVARRDLHAQAEAAAAEPDPDRGSPGGSDPGAGADAGYSASAVPSAQFTERILTRCLDTARSINGGAPADAPALARGLLLLAEARLSRDRPDNALAALEAIHPAWNPELAPQLRHIRTVTLLILGRLDDPRLSDSPDAWLDALDHCASRQLPHARDLHEATRQLRESLTDRQAARLAQIAILIPPAPPPASTDPSPPEGGG